VKIAEVNNRIWQVLQQLIKKSDNDLHNFIFFLENPSLWALINCNLSQRYYNLRHNTELVGTEKTMAIATLSNYAHHLLKVRSKLVKVIPFDK